MLELPGVDRDKVELYGCRFLRLIRNAQEHYENMMGQQEDCPKDPNHETVIHIISDDEDEQQDFHDSGGEDEPGESSAYFLPPPEVEAFNARCRSKAMVPVWKIADKSIVSQIESTSTPATARFSPENRGWVSKKGEGKSRNGYRRGSKNGRKASKGEGGRARRPNNAGSRSDAPGTARFGAMPT